MAVQPGQTGYLFDDGALVGFGNDRFRVILTPREIVNALVRANHYSGTVNIGSAFHFGVYAPGLVGVLSFGTGQNPARGDAVVAGTKNGEWLELDRMWIHAKMPRNTESRAIAFCIKVLRRLRPRLAWIQSFADERCGRYGVVYQAANFHYVGYHRSAFYEIDGALFHSIHKTVKNGPRVKSPKTAFFKANEHRAVKREFRQFRYVYFVKPSFMRRCGQARR